MSKFSWLGRAKESSVLLVDVNPHWAKLTKQCLLLSQIGSVDILETPEDILKSLTTTPYDVLFFNIGDTISDSLKLVRQIRDRTVCSQPDIPLVVMARGASIQDVCDARDAGGTEFLALPMSLKAVERVLKSIFENARPLVETPSFRGPDRRRRRTGVPEDRRK